MKKTMLHLGKRKNYVLIMLVCFGVLASCKDDTTTDSTEQDDAVAEAIINAVSPESGGVITQTDEAVAKAATVEIESKSADYITIECGTAYTDQVTLNGEYGNVTYQMQASWDWYLECTNFGIPENFDMGFAYTRNYSTLRMTSNDTAEGAITVTGLELAASAYVLNTTVDYTGSQASLVGNNNALTTSIGLNFTNLTYNKSTMQIASGTGTVSVSGTFNGQSSLQYGGTIEFLGNNSAILHLNNGNSYDFSW